MTQDVHAFLEAYRASHPEDIRVVREAVADEELTAVASTLAADGRQPVLLFEQVRGVAMPVVTNLFGSRERVARLLGTTASGIHAAYQARSRGMCPPRVVATGPILDSVETSNIDLASIPMLRHFETDRGPYITNGIIAADHPSAGYGNLSYHRAMRHSTTELATSLHSRGHLWRIFQAWQTLKRPMPVAMIIGAHPLFMLAGSGRVPLGVDERHLAGGLFGAPLDVVRTPKYGIAVPAYAEIVLEGVIDPQAHVDEGPFGEFTGYSSNRSTNNLFKIEAILRRGDPILVDVLGGNSAEHLNLGRIPRESEMVEKLNERFPSVTAVHYPNSGTHFHAYVALKQARLGEARQIMVGLLGWDPYLKTVIAVDSDIDITRDAEVLWALATHFQPHRDIVVIDGLPGSALDPSASGIGTTSRVGLDATRGPEFEGIRAKVSDQAMARAAEILARLG
ncbi:MAG: UbiD family decarboxylase [Burkholderiales bacterium]